MKYLDLLARVRECKIKAEAEANALSRASNSGNVREKENAKKHCFRYEHEYNVLRSEATEMIRTSEDKELMRALMLRRVDLIPWEKIIRSICTNRSEMDMRADAYIIGISLTSSFLHPCLRCSATVNDVGYHHQISTLT